MDERVCLAVAAALASEVRQDGPALRQRKFVGGGDALLELVAGGQGCCRGDQLERRAGRVRLLGCAVEQRLVRVGVERLGGLTGRRVVVAGQLRRVIARAGHHGEDFACSRVERHHRPLAVAERRGRHLLDLRDQRGDNAPTPLFVACYQVGDLGHEQSLVLTGQEVVLGSLQASGGVQPVVADDVGVELRGRVLPLELVLVVHRDGACDRLTADHGDRTPLPLEPCGDLAGVAGLVPQGVRVLGL